MSSQSANLTRMLREAASGDRRAVGSLLEAVYDDLRALSARHMRREPAGHTFQATALVHEAYLRLIDQRSATWRDRAHFFAAASQVMRRILVDHARARRSDKRGGAWTRLTLDEVVAAMSGRDVDLVALDEALERLAAISPEQCRIVEMRFFGGLTVPEVAEALGMAKRSVDREWSGAKAWLYRELTP